MLLKLNSEGWNHHTILYIQEEERGLRPNTAKAAAFHVLKVWSLIYMWMGLVREYCLNDVTSPSQSTGIDGSTAEEIMALSTERGIKTDWEASSLLYLKTV